MKRSALFLTVVLSIILLSTSSYAQTTPANPVRTPGINWVDANGDCICDNFGTSKQGIGKGFGKKDGTGNPLRPKNGTGYGSKAGNYTATGVCDGTGPKGNARRSGRK